VRQLEIKVLDIVDVRCNHEAPVPAVLEVGWAPGATWTCVWRREKTSCALQGSVQLVESHYTDWAPSATRLKSVAEFKYLRMALTYQNFLDVKLSPCSECGILSFGRFHCAWILCPDVSKHSVCSICIGRQGSHNLWRWNSVRKRRHIKSRRRGITQKK